MKRVVVFVDDDPTEIETFLDLYTDSRIEVVPIDAPSSLDALSRINDTLDGRRPDLVVLDMFLPTSSDAPSVLSSTAIDSGLTVLQELRQSIDDIEEVTYDNKRLLRQTQGLVTKTEALVKTWCEELGQSPQGGISLLRELDSLYPQTPKMFYSRKATIEDVKQALAAGALDVIRKPDSTRADAEARTITEAFLAACDWQAPRYLSDWQSALSSRVKV